MKNTIKLHDEKLTIDIQFYQNTNMPALIAIDKDHIEYGVLTTNHTLHIRNAISIRDDRNDIFKALFDAGWIVKEPSYTQPSGFINIHYYDLTEEALALVVEKAKEQDLDYPTNCDYQVYNEL